MGAYIKEFNGYIADVPKMWFKRCRDNKVFYFDELTQASVSPQVNFTEVNAGWSLYPVAYLPGQSTFEMQVTSGKFEADLFSMATDTDFEADADYNVFETEHKAPSQANTVTLDHVAIDGTVFINGLEETAADGAPEAGYFKVTTTGSGANEKSLITFNATDVTGVSDVIVSYEYAAAARVAKIKNDSSAIGEAILQYPVYGAAEDCKVSGSIAGYVIMRVYRARVTAMPGLDGSYKSASTFQFTLAAMEDKQHENTYEISYIKNA